MLMPKEAKGLQSDCNVIASEQSAGKLYFGSEARDSTRKAATQSLAVKKYSHG